MYVNIWFPITVVMWFLAYRVSALWICDWFSNHNHSNSPKLHLNVYLTIYNATRMCRCVRPLVIMQTLLRWTCIRPSVLSYITISSTPPAWGLYINISHNVVKERDREDWEITSGQNQAWIPGVTIQCLSHFSHGKGQTYSCCYYIF